MKIALTFTAESQNYLGDTMLSYGPFKGRPGKKRKPNQTKTVALGVRQHEKGGIAMSSFDDRKGLEPQDSHSPRTEDKAGNRSP